MAARKSGLGRNLNALLSQTNYRSVSTKKQKDSSEGSLRHLPIEFLQPGKYQPRKVMDSDALQELSDSIKQQGIIQPIVVRPVSEKQYEIIAGERRWRAAQLAQLERIPVIIRDIPDDKTVAVALIENIQREDLNPMEEARALQRLLEEFDLTHMQVAQAVGKSRTAVTNLLRLVSLNSKVKTLLENGDLEMGHARALLGLPQEQQATVAEEVVNQALSVRETEQRVRRYQQPSPQAKPKKNTDPDILRLEQRLSERLGTKVIFKHQSSGKGKLVIDYHNVEQLEGILSYLN